MFAAITINCLLLLFVGFLLSLRSHGQIGHRGPLLIGVLWITLFLLSVVWLRTSILSNNWPWAAGFLFLHCIYAVSLIPNGNAVIIDRGNTDEEVQYCITRAWTTLICNL